jgi:hypothetical protein
VPIESAQTQHADCRLPAEAAVRAPGVHAYAVHAAVVKHKGSRSEAVASDAATACALPYTAL